jgi:hypothetical protein
MKSPGTPVLTLGGALLDLRPSVERRHGNGLLSTGSSFWRTHHRAIVMDEAQT